MVLPTPMTSAVTATEARLGLWVDGGWQSYRLLNPTLIGKSSACHVRLGGARVGDLHARLIFRGDRWWVERCHPDSVIEVGDARVSERPLHDGDLIKIAGIPMTFQGTLAPEHRPSIPAPESRPMSPRASVERLAHEWAELEIARCEFAAEQESGYASIAARESASREKFDQAQKRLDEERAGLDKLRATSETELHNQERKLDERRRAIESAENELAERQKFLNEEARRLTLRQRKIDDETHRQRDQFSRSMKALGNIRLLMNQRSPKSADDPAESGRLSIEGSATESSIDAVMAIPAGVSIIDTNPMPLLASIEATTVGLPALLESLDRTISFLETKAAAIRDTHEQQRAEARRLDHWARRLAYERVVLENHPVRRQLDELAEGQRALERREGELLARVREWEQGRAGLESDRRAFRSAVDAEYAALAHAREKLRMQRLRFALAYRDRQRQLRTSRRELREQGRQVYARVGEMLRREARLEILKQELHYLNGERSAHLLAVREQDGSVSPDFSPPARRTDDLPLAVADRRRACETSWKEFEKRLSATLAWLDRDIKRTLVRQDASEDGRRLDRHLWAMEQEWRLRETRYAQDRTRYEQRIANLEEELENLAVAMLESKSTEGN